MYLNSIQIIGFIGKDPERRQRQGTRAAYTVSSVASQRSWKNATGEFRTAPSGIASSRGMPFGERATESLHSGDHVYIQGQLVSSAHDRQYGDAEKPTVVKLTFWQVRADAIRKLDRAGNQPGAAPLAAPAPSQELTTFPSDNSAARWLRSLTGAFVVFIIIITSSPPSPPCRSRRLARPGGPAPAIFFIHRIRNLWAVARSSSGA